MLKKYLNKVLTPTKAEEQKEDTQMTDVTKTDANEDATANLLAQATSALAENQAKLTEALEKIASLEQIVKAAKDAEMSAQEQAKQVRLASRKNKIAEAVGTTKADALLAATESLDDAAFDAVVNAMAVNLDAEAKSEAFQEVGKVAKADSEEVKKIDEDKESEELKLLKQKYKSK